MMIASLPRRMNRVSPSRSRQLAYKENPRNLPFGPRARAFGAIGKFWTPGRTLQLSFLTEADEALKDAIFALGRQWIDLCGANLALERVDDHNTEAEIRIICAPKAYMNYSEAGTDALDGVPDTMSLCLVPGHELFEFTVLHEFGHAFGADHEHQHPDADIPWDVPAAISYYACELSGDEALVMREVLDKRPSADDVLKTEYDPTSVMHYPVPPSVTLGDWEVGINATLSEKDLAFMRLAYPHG